MESLLTAKSFLRPGVLAKIRSVLLTSGRHLRGRASSDHRQSYESKSEELDFEVDDNSWSATEQPKSGGRQHWDMFEKARQGFGAASDKFDMTEESDELPARNRFNDRFDKHRRNDQFGGQSDRFRSNDRFGDRYDRNRDRFGQQNKYQKNDRFGDNYGQRNDFNFNDGRNQFNDRRNQFNDRRNQFNDRRNQFNDRRNQFNDRRNQFVDRRDNLSDRRNQYNYGENQFSDRRNQLNDRQRNSRYSDQTDRYIDSRDQREFRNFRFKSYLNEFSDSVEDNDNAIYKDDEMDNEKQRFSHSTEQQYRRSRKPRAEVSDDVDIDEIDDQNDEEGEAEVQSKRDRPKVPIPYNITLENRFEVLNQIITPLHLKPYPVQLKIKFQRNMEVLRRFGLLLKKANHKLIRDTNGMPCPLEHVKPSPIVDRYRNKDEFSIWPGVDGYNKTLGFFIGQPSIHNNVVCVEPDNIIVSRESHLSIAKKFQSYLKDVTQYDSCQNYGDAGHWRRFHIRSNDSGHHMITGIMHPQELSQQELDEEMERFKQFFDGDERISSIFFQPSRHTRLSNEKEPFVHLFGDQTIMETLFDKKFEVSVDSFFQINNRAAEVLYRNVIQELKPTKKTTVLDICCGTGTLATIMAPDVCRVIGIDSSQSAIADAQRNAKLNDIKNVSFICGQVENELPKLTDELYSEEIVVVANPTRGGLHSSVVSLLREISAVRKVVYISCKPEGRALKNFVHLCSPGRHLAPAFLPVNAVPVDMFPHTIHCELILTFERF